MTSRQYNGGAILGRELIDGPDGRRRQGGAWPWDRVEPVVMVKQLAGLAGQDLDHLELREQVVGQEQPVQEREYSRVIDQAVEQSCLSDQAVRALREVPLEVVPAQWPEQSVELVLDGVKLIGRNELGQHHEAVLGQICEIPIDDR